MADFFTKSHELVPEPEGFSKPVFKGQVPSISFSGLKNFEKCPYSLYLDKVALIPRTSGPAAERGTKLHNLLENYVDGTTSTLDYALFKSKAYHQNLITGLRLDNAAGLCTPELKFGFTYDWKPTGFTDDDMKCRGMIDIFNWFDNDHKGALILDWKSGSDFAGASHRDQLLLYVLCCFLIFPTLEYVKSAPVYLDQRKPVFYQEYLRADLAILWPRYAERLRRALDCREFVPNPSGYACKWCSHAKTQESIGQTEPACEWAFKG